MTSSAPKTVKLVHPARSRERTVEIDQADMYRTQGWVEKAEAKTSSKSDKD